MSSNSHSAPSKRQKIKIALAIVLCISTLLAFMGSYRGQEIGGVPLFAVTVAATFLIQWIAYLPAYLKQTERFYDLLGGGGFILATLLLATLSGLDDARSLLLAAMIVLWGLRLAGFLFWRVHRFGGDDRFDEIKPDRLRFFLTWTLQGLWISATASAAWIAMTSTVTKPLGIVSWLGIGLWLFGMALEVIADIQKTIFKLKSQNRGKFISSGLWAISRHPNYLGEIILWLGVFLLAAPVLVDWQWIALLSPAIVILLLTKVSGIPLLEKKAEQKWGADPTYQTYRDSTPVLLPRLKRAQ